MNKYIRLSLLISVLLFPFIGIVFLDPVIQDLSYHNFADRRILLGIPNFFDVVTNLLFTFIGIMGLKFCVRNRQEYAEWSWIIFFLGVALVGIGSAYYHLDPTNKTLVWDRLPMTIGFMGLLIAVLSEYVNRNVEKYFLIPAILIGLFSVIYWSYSDDLRIYICVQLIPLLGIPAAMLLYRGKYTHEKFLGFALISYILAKMTEMFDREIFSSTGNLLSGHSIKHILASVSILFILVMLRKRDYKS